MFGRQKVAALVAEFFGAAVLASAVLAMAGRTGFPFFPAVIAGLTLGLMVLVIGPISGAHVNPIVTLGQWTIRRVPTTQAVVYIAAQMLGGAAAWRLNEYLLNEPLTNRAGNDLDWRVLIAEAVGAFVFAMAVAAAASRAYDGTKLAFTVGTGLLLGMLVASIASNGLINPSLAVGIQSWSWAYVLGPILGAVVGMNLYGLMFKPLDRGNTRTVKTAVAKVAKKAGAKAKKVVKKKQ